MKYTFSATIPVRPYGNVATQIEVEALTYEEAYEYAWPKLEALWNRFVEDGQPLAPNDRKKIEAFVGGVVYFNEFKHEYTNEVGERYLSGSEYEHRLEPPFDAKKISEGMGRRFSVDPVAIREMWDMKSEISRALGTSLHRAMQLHGQYSGLAAAMERTTATHDNPLVSKPVQLFFAKRGKQRALYEVMIVDHVAKRAGQIDRLVLGPDNTCKIEDFKTDVDIEKNLPKYTKQLNFYRAIMEAAGWTVTNMTIYHWNGEKWIAHKIPREDV